MPRSTSPPAHTASTTVHNNNNNNNNNNTKSIIQLHILIVADFHNVHQMLRRAANRPNLLPDQCCNRYSRVCVCVCVSHDVFRAQAHRGIKGLVKDEAGNGIKGARVSVQRLRHDVTAGMAHMVYGVG